MNEPILEIKNLYKTYSSFKLEDISMSINKGEILGFVGRNGAGKTTTLKSIFNIVHPDKGEIIFKGKPFLDDELNNKQKSSLLLGGVDYYPKTKLKVLTDVTKRFYKDWDEKKYEEYLAKFALDENKRVNELSAGMKVKYGLAVSLSHHGELLVLDEPTSGLDPVSRDELLEIFERLADEEGVAILFSTHITSDLEKCADKIAYIQKGRLIAFSSLADFKGSYAFVKGKSGQKAEELKSKAISYHERKGDFEALFYKKDLIEAEGFEAIAPDLDTVMVYLEREKEDE